MGMADYGDYDLLRGCFIESEGQLQQLIRSSSGEPARTIAKQKRLAHRRTKNANSAKLAGNPVSTFARARHIPGLRGICRRS
jgi:hypothetical protein